MTDVDLIMDFECCLRKNCEKCSREGEDGCADRLQREALLVMKMQYQTLVDLHKKMNALESECEQLKEKAELGLVKNEIVKGVNSLIGNLRGNDMEGEGYYEAVTDILSFLRTTGLHREFNIVIDVDRGYPQIGKK